MFYDQYLNLCNRKGVSPTRAALDIGVSKTSVTRWKDGATPNGDILKALADYFGVSVDYLLNGTDPNHPEYDVTLDDFSYAMLEESGALSDADKQTLLDMARLMRKRQHEEGKDKA